MCAAFYVIITYFSHDTNSIFSSSFLYKLCQSFHAGFQANSPWSHRAKKQISWNLGGNWIFKESTLPRASSEQLHVRFCTTEEKHKKPTWLRQVCIHLTRSNMLHNCILFSLSYFPGIIFPTHIFPPKKKCFKSGKKHRFILYHVTRLFVCSQQRQR